MNSSLLLIGISSVPAITGILLTLPLWHIRYLHNRAIFVIGLVILIVLIVAGLVLAFLNDKFGYGFVCIAVSTINVFIYRHYERLLETSRCSFCHFNTLHIHSCQNGRYKLYCRNCGLHSEWEE